MAENAKKKSGFSFRRLIYNDKYLIIISLILAVVIWVVASINIGTDEAKTVKLNVPITLGDEISEQYGMQYYSLQDNIELNVTISGPKYVIGQVTDNDFSVNFDSSSVNRTGVQNIPILVTNNSRTLDFDVTNTYPSSIEAYFDVNKTKTFDVEVEFDKSKIENGYVFGNPILSESKVVVSGPQAYVDKVEAVYVDVDFENEGKLTKPYNTDAEIKFKGLGVEANYLTVNSVDDSANIVSNESVTIPVLKETVLPVSVGIDGAPKEATNAISIRYSVNRLNVGVLGGANINQAEIGKINYNQLTVGQNVFEFDVSNLQGITVLDEVKTVYVYVNVNRSYKSQTVDISNVPINVEGTPNGKTANVVGLDNTSLTVIAPKGAVVTADNIEIVADVSKKNKSGLYTAQITIKSNSKAWIYGKYNVEIELK